jgi:hypothetical protein
MDFEPLAQVVQHEVGALADNIVLADGHRHDLYMTKALTEPKDEMLKFLTHGADRNSLSRSSSAASSALTTSSTSAG